MGYGVQQMEYTPHGGRGFFLLVATIPKSTCSLFTPNKHVSSRLVSSPFTSTSTINVAICHVGLHPAGFQSSRTRTRPGREAPTHSLYRHTLPAGPVTSPCMPAMCTHKIATTPAAQPLSAASGPGSKVFCLVLPTNNPGRRISHPARLKHDVCTQMQRSTVPFARRCNCNHGVVALARWGGQVTLPRCCGGAIGGLSILRRAGVVCGVETQFPSDFSLVAFLIDFAPASSSKSSLLES